MKYEIMKKETKANGFTLIEVLISLLLVSVAIIATARIITFAFEEYRAAVARYRLVQTIGNFENTLMTKPFDSNDLADGSYAKNEDKFDLAWNISGLSPTFKKIKLTVSHRGGNISYRVGKKTVYFYKSKFINNLTSKEKKND